MDIQALNVEGRTFINFGNNTVIPLDCIKRFDFDIPRASVHIITDDPESNPYFMKKDCESVLKWLTKYTGLLQHNPGSTWTGDIPAPKQFTGTPDSGRCPDRND